jgi:hypothetical protein
MSQYSSSTSGWESDDEGDRGNATGEGNWGMPMHTVGSGPVATEVREEGTGSTTAQT